MLTYLLGKCDNPEILDLLGNATESLALLGHANRQLCMLRRESMKPDMKGEYTHLCSHNLKYTDYLFGDDVPKTVKDITDCSKISNKIGIGYREGFRGRSTRGRARGRFVRGAARGRVPTLVRQHTHLMQKTTNEEACRVASRSS